MWRLPVSSIYLIRTHAPDCVHVYFSNAAVFCFFFHPVRVCLYPTSRLWVTSILSVCFSPCPQNEAAPPHNSLCFGGYVVPGSTIMPREHARLSQWRTCTVKQDIKCRFYNNGPSVRSTEGFFSIIWLKEIYINVDQTPLSVRHLHQRRQKTSVRL